MLKRLDHKKNFHYLLILVLFLHIVLPILIFGHVGLIPHDTLEGLANDYIISKIYRFNFEYLDYFSWRGFSVVFLGDYFLSYQSISSSFRCKTLVFFYLYS